MTQFRCDRRTLLGGLIGAALAPVPASAGEAPVAALLVPLTGPAAGLGRSLDQAARLALPGPAGLVVCDSGATPASAAAAAAAARRRGVPLIIGPVFGAQTAAAVAAAREVPLMALSNDPAGGGFVLGVTPAQSVAAILAYARARGVRRVAVTAGATRWDTLAGAAATNAARALGLELVDAAIADALLVTGDAGALTTAARTAGGIQLLATHQAVDLSGVGLAAVAGAWLAAPDPSGFGDFARRFEAAHGTAPGQLAGLAYDAVGIARSLRASGYAPRDGLRASAGFAGVTGAVRFAADGTASRDLAIMVAEDGRWRPVSRSAT